MTARQKVAANLAHTAALIKRAVANLAHLRAIRARQRAWLAAHPAPAKPVTVMYDSTTIDQIPADAKAVAGYVGGNWTTYPKLVQRFPHARVVSIAVASWQAAECVDRETGDVPAALVPAWVGRAKARGVKRPIVYVSASEAQSLVNLLFRSGYRRSSYRLWTAHYTGREHLCGPRCGFGQLAPSDATQWTDKALGRNLDQSLTTPSFWT